MFHHRMIDGILPSRLQELSSAVSFSLSLEADTLPFREQEVTPPSRLQTLTSSVTLLAYSMLHKVIRTFQLCLASITLSQNSLVFDSFDSCGLLAHIRAYTALHATFAL